MAGKKTKTEGKRIMYSEITKAAFDILTANVKFGDKVSEPTELAQINYYNVYGVQVKSIYNHVSQIEQYYIQDINA